MTGGCRWVMTLGTVIAMRLSLVNLSVVVGRVFLLAVLVVCFVFPKQAQGQAPKEDSRCEWTDCSASAAPQERSTLRVCREEDRATCGDECRAEFDQQYFRCIDRCLSTRCQESAQTGARDAERAPGWESDLCIEGESARCASECLDRGEGNQPRCRLACLGGACPNAPRKDIAEEAAKPGIVACRRCRAREERECRRACGVGFSARPEGSYSGLGSYACEKACIAGACGGGCAF